ncbi:MAG: transporter substrate-binding domain-containing protein [Tatlockia sp.]|nr:transporter substrate-binding domain-containing protein [Tatlockia sp.]
MKFKWLPLLLTGLISLLLPSTGQAQLKIGVMFFDPPLVMSPMQGFHVDLANKICQGLQEKCILLPMVWNQLFVAIDKGDIDLIIGVFITAQRAKKYIFSIPYMQSYGRFIVLRASNITNFKQLNGKKVGTLKEEVNTGIFASYLQANYSNNFKIVDYKDIGVLLTSLVNKSIKAALLHARAVNYWVANTSGIFSILGPVFPLGGGYSIMALPGNQPLIDKINQQIQLIKANGEFAKIYDTYFFDAVDLSIPKPQQ